MLFYPSQTWSLVKVRQTNASLRPTVNCRCTASKAPSTVESPLSIPPSILHSVQAANSSWAQKAELTRLKEPGVNATIHLIGTANFAPKQEELVSASLSHLQPDLVALELPLRVHRGLPGSAMLPYPAFVQILMDHLPAMPGQNHPAAESTGRRHEMQRMCEELRAAGAEVSTSKGIGRDIFDPFEATGYFSGAELAVRPQQIGQAVELFGITPGLEYATAAAWALDKEAQLLCLDASLPLQQAWVDNLVSRFELREADLPRRLQAEWRAALEVVPAEHSTWDFELGLVVSRLTSGDAFVEKSDQQDSGSGSRSGAGVLGEAGMSGAAFGADHAMTAYKVCKATAAAMLDPEATQQAVLRQAQLQPLKFAHFERRALHMATQLLECSRRLKHPTPRATILESALLLLVPWPVRRNAALVMQAWKRQRARSSSSSSSSSGRVSVSDDLLSPGLQDASLHDGSLHDGSKPSGPAPYVIAAVVGRQYVPMIRRLWDDPNSELWRGDVPRTFAPSVIEPILDEIDPDVASGGSRPVGQVPKVFGADGGLHEQPQQQVDK